MPSRPHTSQGQYTFRGSAIYVPNHDKSSQKPSAIVKLSNKFSRIFSKVTMTTMKLRNEQKGVIRQVASASSLQQGRTNSSSAMADIDASSQLSRETSSKCTSPSTTGYKCNWMPPSPISPMSDHKLRRSVSSQRCTSKTGQSASHRSYVPATLHLCSLGYDPFAAGPMLRRKSRSSRSLHTHDRIIE
jgi:hypothetical protein